MNKNLKTFFTVAGMAVVIVGVGSWINSPSGADGLAAITGRKGTAVPVTNPSPTPAASTDNAMYNQLVQQYRNARIQFKANCQAAPTNVSFKNGASVLLDNRANEARTIVVGANTYQLPAYGYQLVTLSSSTVPGTLSVSCGSSVNVSTIKLFQ